MATPARRAGLRVAGGEGGARAHRDAEDVRPAARRARGPAVPRRRAARQASSLPDRRRRARAPRPPDDVRAGSSSSSAGEKGPKTPAFALEFQDGSKLVLTENARKKRAGVWLLTPEAAESELAHLGPEALGLGPEQLGEIVHGESRRLHALLRDQRLIAGHRPRVGERDPPRGEALAVRALERPRRRGGRRASRRRSTPSSSAASSCARRGASDEKTYRVHRRLGEPCHVCGTPIAQVDFEEHTIFYCPTCQTGGRVLKDRRLSRLLR